MEEGSEKVPSQRSGKSVVRLYLLETAAHDTATTWLPKQDLGKGSTNRGSSFLTTESFCVISSTPLQNDAACNPTHELVFLIYFSPFLYFVTYSNF